MPIYEFACRHCGRRFEMLVRIGGETGVCCPECGSGEVRKLISGFGIGGSRLKASSSSCGTCSSHSCSTCH